MAFRVQKPSAMDMLSPPVVASIILFAGQISLAGFPETKIPGETFLFTREWAPTTAPSPISTPGRMVQAEATTAYFRITTPINCKEGGLGSLVRIT